MSETTWVLCTRHPDYANEYITEGDVRIIDIDLGSSFTAGQVDDGDLLAVAEAAMSWRENAEDAPLTIRRAVEDQISALIDEAQLREIAGSTYRSPVAS